MAPRTLTPPVLGADASQKAVAALRKHLSAQLSPVLCVEDAALAARCRAMATTASAARPQTPDARQEAFPLDGPDWSQLREDLTALAERTLRRLAPDVPQLPLDARLCLRRYPPGKRASGWARTSTTRCARYFGRRRPGSKFSLRGTMPRGLVKMSRKLAYRPWARRPKLWKKTTGRP